MKRKVAHVTASTRHETAAVIAGLVCFEVIKITDVDKVKNGMERASELRKTLKRAEVNLAL